MQLTLVRRTLDQAGLATSDQSLPAAIHVQHGVNKLGKRLHYYFNYSANPVTAPYAYAPGTDLLTDQAVAPSTQLTIAPWDLVIVEETAPASKP
jgi:beta-galactosidase